jgi:hypothetical protein
MTPMWFLTSTKDNFINRNEIPLDTAKLQNLADESQPINMWQSLMQTIPGNEPKFSSDQVDVIKEALLDCLDLLRDQDKFVIDAIIYEQITYPKLADRLRCIHTSCVETYTSCVCKP